MASSSGKWSLSERPAAGKPAPQSNTDCRLLRAFSPSLASGARLVNGPSQPREYLGRRRRDSSRSPLVATLRPSTRPRFAGLVMRDGWRFAAMRSPFHERIPVLYGRSFSFPGIPRSDPRCDRIIRDVHLSQAILSISSGRVRNSGSQVVS